MLFHSGDVKVSTISFNPDATLRPGGRDGDRPGGYEIRV